MIAFLYPGQGSQSVGMARFLYDEFSIAKNTFEEASDILNLDFKKLCFDGPQENLNLTENTQPALVLASTTYHRVLKSLVDIPPHIMAGHSLGEYSALVASESLSFQDALELTKSRGKFMQEAVPVGKGAMLAILGLEETDVEKICAWVNERVSFIEPANYNAHGQIVVSGTKEACDFLKDNFPSDIINKKAKMIPLNVSAPFHCALMKPAEEKMALLLEQAKIQDAKSYVIQNIDAKEHKKASEIRKNLIAQISGPVRWTASIKRALELEAKFFIELGPGKVLSGLVKKIDSNDNKTFNIQNLDDLKQLEKNWANLNDSFSEK